MWHTIACIIISLVSFADTYNPNTIYSKGDEAIITINGEEVLIEYINNQPSSQHATSTPYDLKNAWLWSVSSSYSGEWVPFHYILFPDRATQVQYGGNTYELQQEMWTNSPTPAVASQNNEGWACIDCSESSASTCPNVYSADYFPLLLAQQNNGYDETTPVNYSGNANIISGQGGYFMNINQQRKCRTPLALYNNDIYFRDACDPHIGLGYYGKADNDNVPAPQKRMFADHDVDGPVMYGWNGGALGIRQRKNLNIINGPHIEKIALQWTPGYVRIGTPKIPMPLVLTGGVKHTNIKDNKIGLYFSGTDLAKMLTIRNTSSRETVFQLYGTGELRTKSIWTESLDVVANVEWPDFVFSPNYALRSLYDVEAFVLENKHLPDVPSAEDVKTDGINVAEMNAVLLQKVEELTLYLIALQKQLDETERKLEAMQE
jgi:hypothetical protein